MPAPFPLPSLCSVYDQGGINLLHGDVPCRYIPTFQKGKPLFIVGVDLAWSGPIATVDIDPAFFVQDAAILYAAATQSLYKDGGYILTVQTAVLSIRLRVVWYEPRYLNTPKAYYRMYCERLSQVAA